MQQVTDLFTENHKVVGLFYTRF